MVGLAADLMAYAVGTSLHVEGGMTLFPEFTTCC
jgi:hypothetical protein